ncbi:hypothetical protein [Aquimarina intermedia]|uniref:Uncharacterized protein n=1 Tax=Aquimarina intermedia TaxID=350814 RepID=A0A5S5C2V0_9FLAO|nr:hypothetical protein [Aquimarina intermedia]TYP72802.1 hypothetical protein BD809_10650 [Aquimarina intermedia]
MSSIFNQVLILFSTLFNVNSEIVADRSELLLDLQNQTATITYYDLETSENVEKLFIQEDLKRIKQATKFNSSYEFLSLSNVAVEAKKNSVDITITFTFDKFSDVGKFINLKLVDGNIIYPQMEMEKVTSSNGKKMRLEELDVIAWDATTKIFELAIKRDKNIDKYQNFETIAPYFE